MDLLVLLALFVALALSAQIVGYDSRDDQPGLWP